MLLSNKKYWALIVGLLLMQAVMALGNTGVTLTTREYDNYRRFIIDIKDNELADENVLIKPEIKSLPDSGRFTVFIRSENDQKFEGEILRKAEGQIPVRFVVSYPDSKTIKIEGKTGNFDKITSFYIMSENKYVFDIFEYDINDNYYSSSVQLLNEAVRKPKSTVAEDSNLFAAFNKTDSRPEKPETANNSLLTQSIKTAAMILSGLVFLLLATYFIIKIYSGRSLFHDLANLSHTTPKESARPRHRKTYPKKSAVSENRDYSDEAPGMPRKKVRQPVPPVINESAINSMLFDKKEQKIRKIMHQKNLNYNEAEMVFNLSHKSYSN